MCAVSLSGFFFFFFLLKEVITHFCQRLKVWLNWENPLRNFSEYKFGLGSEEASWRSAGQKRCVRWDKLEHVDNIFVSLHTLYICVVLNLPLNAEQMKGVSLRHFRSYSKSPFLIGNSSIRDTHLKWVLRPFNCIATGNKVFRWEGMTIACRQKEGVNTTFTSTVQHSLGILFTSRLAVTLK